MGLLAVLASAGYTAEGEERFAELLAEGESLAQGDAAILEKLQLLGERFGSQKRARMDELQTIAEFRLNRADSLPPLFAD